MGNRPIILAIGLCLLAAGIGKLLADSPATADAGRLLLSWGLGLGQLLGFILLIANGTILSTIYARIILLFYALLLVGVSFKLTHWLGADALLWISLTGVALTYSVRFARKKPKNHLDILKLLLVLASSGSALLLLLHLVPREAAYVAPSLLWLAVLDFLYLESRKRAAMP